MDSGDELREVRFRLRELQDRVDGLREALDKSEAANLDLREALNRLITSTTVPLPLPLGDKDTSRGY